MDQNNLDKLFQKKLEDFSSVPDEAVWNRIETSLNSKRKKRVIPIWWSLGGAAAILIFAMLLFNPFAVDENLNQNSVGDSNQKEVLPAEKEDRAQPAKNELLLERNGAEELANQEENSTESIEEGNKTKSGSKSIAPNKGAIKNNLERQLASSNSEDTKNQVVQKQEKGDFFKISENADGQDVELEGKDSRIVELDKPKVGEKGADEAEVKEAVAISDEVSEKKSIYDAIEEELEGDTEVAEKNAEKWTIAPSVAPVYFNSIGEGSPIHSNFRENSKSGKINMSFGVAIAYDVGKKLKIRSGVHRVNMGYGTDDILFSSSVEGSTNAMIDNIDYNATSRSLVVESRKNTAVENLSDVVTSQELNANENPARDGTMVQQLGYFEVPLELNYALVDKKFGVDLIGGVSSLFLVDNSVSLESQDGLVTEMGEANNVNSMNFSTNVGLGLNYQFSEKIQLNVEPIFKYQLNTFTESAGNFNPYSIGVYSGLSFKF